MRLIGITGAAGAGKDTAAAWFVAEHGARRYSFATPIKEALSVMFGIPAAVFEDRVAKEQPVEWLGRSPRYLAQRLGTEFGRDLVGPDVWVAILARRLLAAGFEDPRSPPVVIPDVRFPNEATFVRKTGVLLHLRRQASADLGADSGHVSEAGITPRAGDVVIDNDGTIADLYGVLALNFSARP